MLIVFPFDLERLVADARSSRWPEVGQTATLQWVKTCFCCRAQGFDEQKTGENSCHCATKRLNDPNVLPTPGKVAPNTDLDWGDKQGMECTDCTVPFRNQTWEMSICKLCHFPLITLNCQDRSPKGYTISTKWFEQFEYILENKASASRLLIKYANFNQSKHQHDRNSTLFQLSLVVQDRPLPLRGDSEGGLSASTKKTAARGSSLKMKICIA